ncbi:unnamed protein product, partial [Porites evermanni]
MFRGRRTSTSTSMSQPPEGHGVTMEVVFRHEKPDATNMSHNRVFTYTALEDGSPYYPVALGFLHLARRTVFLKTPREAWERQNFQLRGGVADWPLFCQTDKSTHTLK